ncbi:helix-turn-helix transcriptional regulator [Desulfogranum japonicum]|uniref:helix-turn-helix transcriptional regulator n=1 Tax=Desulfogranum japonicum TaxID=231447 RepID=UPI0003F91D54|nr:helix-turn-helix transcriptional regulator [Desulfogranum japonicum]
MSSVQIDGDAVRSLREEKGLTQLYLATVVGVTTDTISRWENRKYPSIKFENAEKLAQALEVEIDQILDADNEEKYEEQEEQTTDVESPEILQEDEQGEKQDDAEAPLEKNSSFLTHFSKRTMIFSGIIILLLCIIALLLALNLTRDNTTSPNITAVRTAPTHTGPNQPFPVIVRVRGDKDLELPILLREEIEGYATAESLSGKSRNHQFETKPRWIGKLQDGKAAFLYMVIPDAKTTHTDTIRFFGNCMSGETHQHGEKITGQSVVAIAPFHWADVDRNYIITDNEILKAYEEYTIPGSIGFDFSEAETLWLAGRYFWDENTKTFQPQPQQ